MRKLHGVRLPHAKSTAHTPFEILPVPEKVLIPMQMHIGTVCEPIVKLRQNVTVGECIGTSDAQFSADIHASVSGTVTAITEYRPAKGAPCKAVEITSDGEQTTCPALTVPTYENRAEFLDAVHRSGAVGMGGAGLPVHIKLNPKQKIDCLLVNAAECEPYITADDRIMQEKPQTVIAGIRRILDVLEIPAAMIGVEKNKPEAIQKLEQHTKEDGRISLMPLPPVYPQGAEKVLIYHLTGRIVQPGQLPADAGVLVMNVSTICFLEDYFNTGMPLVSRGVTVDGDCVKSPRSLWVPIGAPVRSVLDAGGCDYERLTRLVSGGPMMGMCLPNPDYPVTKTMNAVLALAKAKKDVTTACIRCGRCIHACPLRLMPTELEKAYDRRDAKALRRLRVDLCMLCGCCSYVCPAKRPLAETNALAKTFLRKEAGQ